MKKIIFGLSALAASTPAFAQDAATAAVTAGNKSGSGLIGVAVGLAIGMAAIGGATGMGKIGGSAMDGIARNPQAQKAMFVPMIISLVFAEATVILAFVVALLLQGKI